MIDVTLAGSPLVTAAVMRAAQYKSKHINIGVGTNGWASDTFPLITMPDVATITSLKFYSFGGNGIVLNLEERTNPNVAGTDILSTNTYFTTGGVEVTSFANAGIAAGATITLTSDSVTGDVQSVIGYIKWE